MFVGFSLGTRCAFSLLGISGNRWSSDGIPPLSTSFARATNNINRHQALQSEEEEACQRQENDKSQNVIMFVSTWHPCFQPVCTLQSCTVRIYLQSCTAPDNACTRWLKDRLEENISPFTHQHNHALSNPHQQFDFVSVGEKKTKELGWCHFNKGG